MKNKSEKSTNNQGKVGEDRNDMIVFSISATVTKREKEVLTHVAQGHTSQAIAEKLFLSADTIETHRKNIFKKFGVKNMAHAMAHAFRNNLLQ